MIDFDAAVIGGGLAGAMSAALLGRRGLRVAVLEARRPGQQRKALVGEAVTEGTSVFLRHELGLTDWLRGNAFRKFGFDFLTLPRAAAPPPTMDGCHELLLSTTPLEKIAPALARLVPTYHVERLSFDAAIRDQALAAGVTWHESATVEGLDLDEGGTQTVRYRVAGGDGRRLTCRFVLDCTGRRTLLGNQLGLVRAAPGLDTAAIWNRFENVNADAGFWRTFHGIDRRRHTIHFTGHGFWIWWIHLNADVTSVGVSFDRGVHRPDVKADDRGFSEMIRKFPAVAEALSGARPTEPYQFYAHLPYRADRWIGDGWALIGDAAWFTDALYSTGIETACRQLANLAPILEQAAQARPVERAELDRLNAEFESTKECVLRINQVKYRHGWHAPEVGFQTAVYELGDIADVYHLQSPARWTPAARARHYHLPWHPPKRGPLLRFLESSLGDAERSPATARGRLLKKALLPGRTVYAATWPLWKIDGMIPYFFRLIRAWAWSERMTQRTRLWPDGLARMAADGIERPLVAAAAAPAGELPAAGG